MSIINPIPSSDPRGEYVPKADVMVVLFSVVTILVMSDINAKLRVSTEAYELAFADYALYHVAFAAVGLVLYLVSTGFRFRFWIAGLKIFRMFLWMLVLLFFMIILESILIRAIERAAVVDEILGMYFLFSGCSEEMLFRVGIISITGTLTRQFPFVSATRRRTGSRGKNRKLMRMIKKIILIVVVVVQAVVFASLHSESLSSTGITYGDRPALMLSLFGMAIGLGMYYMLTADAFPLVGAHMIRNLYSFYG